jgi:hypothetical protein
MVLPVLGQCADLGDDLGARDRVDAGERLVEDQQVGVVGQGGGQLGALAHALGVALDPSVHRALHAHHLERRHRGGRGLGARHAGQVRQRGHQLAAGELVVGGLVLGAVADAAAHQRIDERVAAVDLDRAAAGPQEAAHQLHQRRLAGAVGTEQADHAAAHGPGDVADAQHRAVPLRAALGDDDRGAHELAPTAPAAWRLTRL